MCKEYLDAKNFISDPCFLDIWVDPYTGKLVIDALIITPTNVLI